MFSTSKFADFPLFRLNNQIRLEALGDFKPKDVGVNIAQTYFTKKEAIQVVKEGYVFYLP